MEKQNQISTLKLRTKIGKTLEVLIDEVNDKDAVARSHADAPEIDGQVLIENAADLKPGDVVNVLIQHSGDYDLWGKVVE